MVISEDIAITSNFAVMSPVGDSEMLVAITVELMQIYFLLRAQDSTVRQYIHTSVRISAS